MPDEQQIDLSKPFSVNMKAGEERSITLSFNPAENIFLLETVNPSSKEGEEGTLIKQQLFLNIQEFNCIFPMYQKIHPYLMQTIYKDVTAAQLDPGPQRDGNQVSDSL